VSNHTSVQKMVPWMDTSINKSSASAEIADRGEGKVTADACYYQTHAHMLQY